MWSPKDREGSSTEQHAASETLLGVVVGARWSQLTQHLCTCPWIPRALKEASPCTFQRHLHPDSACSQLCCFITCWSLCLGLFTHRNVLSWAVVLLTETIWGFFREVTELGFSGGTPGMSQHRSAVLRVLSCSLHNICKATWPAIPVASTPRSESLSGQLL